MAHLEQTSSGNFHVRFRIGQRKYKRSLKITSRKVADAALGRLKETLWLLNAGHIELPEAGDVTEFLFTGSKRNGKLSPPKVLTIRELFEQFANELPTGALEKTTLRAIEVHSRHFCRILGARMPTADVSPTTLQHYVNTRSRESGARGRTVARGTIKYELTSLRIVWKWAHTHNRIERAFPNQDLRLPKTDERQPFRTRAEIEPEVDPRRWTKKGSVFAIVCGKSNSFLPPSALSQLDFGIDGFKFAPGVVDFHLPIDTSLSLVDISGPSSDLCLKRFQVGDATPRETLAG